MPQDSSKDATSMRNAPGPVPEGATACLVLGDGSVFWGRGFGAFTPPGAAPVAEVCFNTGMTGYQETLTDPSYHRQVVVMTSPHVGNTGINDEDPESRRIWVSGYVVRDPSRVPSNWRSARSLDDELRDQGVVGISGIDTRASGVARTDHADATVRSLAFWLKSTKTPSRSSFHHRLVARSGTRRSTSRATVCATDRTCG